MADLVLENISKVFDSGDEEIIAVNDISLDIKDGEFLVLVGPSGCGKSTTLRTIAGLEEPTEGTIRIGGTVVNGLQPNQRNIAMVFQNYALYPHKSVAGNIEFGLKMSTDLSKQERKEKVEEVAELLEIEDLLDQKPRNLSGGQQQRAALGRAIARSPEVFLFDEPLSNLDAKLRTSMRTEIQRLQNELGTTSIYVTHDQEEAMTMSDRIAILNGGELQQVGTPAEVYYEPTNRFVASFIGSPSMNFLPVEFDADQEVLKNDGHTIAISEALAQRLGAREAESFHLGVRPEHTRVVESDAQIQLETTLEVVEPMGSDNFIHYKLNEYEFTTRVSGQEFHEEGETVLIGFDESDMYLFDAQTTEAVTYPGVPEEGDEVQAYVE